MFADDLDSFLDTDEGAVSAVIDGGDPITVRYLEEYVEVDLGRTTYSGVKPVLWGKRSELEGNADLTVVVNSANYTIISVEKLDTLTARAILKEV